MLERARRQREAIQVDLDALIAGANERVERAREEYRSANPTASPEALDTAITEDLTTDEQTQLDGLLERRRPLDERIDALERADQALRTSTPGSTVVQIRSEPLTYQRENPRASFLHDLASSRFRGDDMAALDRLARHRREMSVELAGMEPERRSRFQAFLGEEEGRSAQTRADMSRTDGVGGEFVPPLWAMELYTDLPRGGRPVADLVRGIPLPAGTDSISIPRIVTGSAVAAHAETAAVNETNPTTGSVTAGVKTMAGQITTTMQLIDQSPVALDQILFDDLFSDLDYKIELAVLNGAGGANEVLGILGTAGINTVTYTDASPTVGELHPKVADAINQSGTNRKRPPTHAIYAFRRWMWILAALDSAGRPLVPPSAQAYNPIATASGLDTAGAVGGHLLIPAVADVSMPTNLGAGTNEDRVIVLNAADNVLFEGQVRARVLQEAKGQNLELVFQVWKYIAFTAGRYPSGTSVIAGTGLVTPTF